MLPISLRSIAAIFLGAAVFGVAAQTGTGDQACARTWLRDAKIGVSTHYFPQTPESVDEVANSLDVVTLAKQAAQVKAGWFLFTVHHQNWLFMAPNEAFARIVGSRDMTAKRDVPADLIRELKKYGIKTMLYVNIRLVPTDNIDKRIVTGMGRWPPDDRMIENMAAVYRELSLRYGADVAGWWVDGAGTPEYVRSPDRERWFGHLAAAMRAGNPKALVAFNPGVKIARYSRSSDYVAGEAEDLKLPNGPCLDGAQWHSWTYLGGFWGADGTRFSSPELCRFASNVLARGGAVTLEIGTWGIERDGVRGPRVPRRAAGVADPKQIAQLADVQRRLRSGPNGTPACEQ